MNRDTEKRPGERRMNGEGRFERRPDAGKERRGEDRPPRGGERRFDGRPAREGERRFERRPEGGRRFERRPVRGGEARFEAGRKPATRTARDAALDALRGVVRENAYASQALSRSLNGARLSEEDARLAASIFYFAVENRLRIEWMLAQRMENKPEPVVSDILHIALAQVLFMDKIPDHAIVDEAVKQVRAAGREGLTGLVNAVLRGLIRARDAGELTLPDPEDDPTAYLSVRYSMAEAAVRRLIDAYGFDRTESILAFSPRHTTTIRPNVMRLDAARFEAYLDQQALHWTRGAVPGSYVIAGAGDLSGHPGYRAGLFSIQGESSMLAAQAVDAKPGMQILDACAAPGGKTCLMAEQMRGAGRVYAWDLHPHRVELIRAAARRLQLENVRPAVHDAKRFLESMEMAMDAVLVDAPCSGLGVTADKPDIKYRLKDEDFDSILPVQRDILDACARNVRVGGRLVYSTCTIMPEENELQVRAFLDRHPEFEPDSDVSYLPEALRSKVKDGMLQLLPDRDGVEGFFIARMRRRLR